MVHILTLLCYSFSMKSTFVLQVVKGMKTVVEDKSSIHSHTTTRTVQLKANSKDIF